MHHARLPRRVLPRASAASLRRDALPLHQQDGPYSRSPWVLRVRLMNMPRQGLQGEPNVKRIIAELVTTQEQRENHFTNVESAQKNPHPSNAKFIRIY